MSEIDLIRAVTAYGRVLAARVRVDERGEVTEKVMITAIFAALALAAGAVIVTKVMSKANSIPTQ